MKKISYTPRDISWLSFNARVLQEANDPNVPLPQRIRFLGIHSNNMDEFFRVRVATLRRMIALGGKKTNMHLEENPDKIIEEIQTIVLSQQSEFNRIWKQMQKEMEQQNVFLITEKKLDPAQKKFVKTFYEEEVSQNIIPLMIESIPQMPFLRDKSIFLGVVMRKKESAYNQKFALIEVPSRILGRFVKLPSPSGQQHIILLEDVIRFNLPYVFSYFGYDTFDAHIFKVTKDAEIDIDNDITTSFVQKIEKGLKNRRKGRPVRFIYDRHMDASLLAYLMKKLNLTGKDNVIPGGRIHNFRHFMDFPNVFAQKDRRVSFAHPSLKQSLRVTDIILKEDVMLHFPYHSFNHIIDLLREAAFDPEVVSIKITAYRLAPASKIINALINAVRNGKQVTVMLELRARFDEEANLEWKERLEDEGVTVLVGQANMKVHAKLCVIKKKAGKKILQYGFVSTGNLNEKTAKVYGDHCLLTSNRNIMADINRLFKYFENPKSGLHHLHACKTLMTCPENMRRQLNALIDREIRAAKSGKAASIILKLNSFSDTRLINKIYDAAIAGVEIKMIVRGIFCPRIQQKKLKNNISAISIVDEYLEHARVLIFHNGGNEKIFISSADFMIRNLDHRIEAAVPVLKEHIRDELKDIIHIQLRDNAKARILDNDLSNNYVPSAGKKQIRSQVETYNYLHKKTIKNIEVSSH